VRSDIAPALLRSDQLKVLFVHNRYQQRGGEDVVFETDRDLLRAHGHEVVEFVLTNDAIQGAGTAVSAAVSALWNGEVHAEVRRLIRKHRPHVVHCINLFPLASPSVYYAARAEAVPVVQTVQNYRLVCPNAQLLRNGAPCEKCITQIIPWSGVVHRCYRGSFGASAATATMLSVHRALGTWHRMVDMFVVPTRFMADKLRRGGLPGDRIAVRDNCLVSDPGIGDHDGAHALFVGRISPEKGIATLLEAWRHLQEVMPLRIVGGPVPTDRSALANVEWRGVQDRQRTLEEMRRARMLVFPSIWYEGQPLVLLEALATGLPVIASDLGAMHEMFSASDAGRLFPPGDGQTLAQLVAQLNAAPETLQAMSHAARATFLDRFSSETGYRSLMDIYAGVTGAPMRAATDSNSG
jgi:glycosyltransferase involved in cell wall biosynthesis